MKRLLISLLIFLLVGTCVWWLQQSSSEVSKPNESCEINETHLFLKKLELIFSTDLGSEKAVTKFSELEVNTFLSQKGEEYFPSGISQIQVDLQEDVVLGQLLADFDKVRSSLNRPSSPLVTTLLTGKHTVKIESRITTKNGSGRYEILNVLLNGQQVPKIFVDFLLENYVFSKYPVVKPNTPFDLPFKIETIRIQPDRIIIKQVP